MPTVIQHLINRIKLGRIKGHILMSSEDGSISNQLVKGVIVGGNLLSVQGNIAYLHSSIFNASFNIVANGGPFSGLSVFEKGYVVPSVTLSFASTNPGVYPYCNYENLKMNGSGITLDIGNPTLATDTYTPGGGISEAQEGSGFTTTIRGGLSCDKTADKGKQLIWGQFAYYGYNASVSLSEAQIEALTTTSIMSSLGSSTYAYGANPGTTYLWYCFPDSWGNITAIFDPVSGFDVITDWQDTGVVSITNAQGFSENYRCWRTNFPNSGSDWQMRIS